MIFRNGILAIFLLAFATLSSFLYFANSSGNIARYMELNQQASLYCVTFGSWLTDKDCISNNTKDVSIPVPVVLPSSVDKVETAVQKNIVEEIAVDKKVSNNYYGVDKQYVDGQISYIRNEIISLPTKVINNTSSNYTNRDFLTKQVDVIYDSVGRTAENVSNTLSELTTTDIPEENNLYYTDDRVSSYLSASSTLTSSLNFWTKVGDDLSYVSGKVGIGTTTPNGLFGVYEYIDFNNTDFNTNVGYQAGKNVVSLADSNTFFGYQAGMGTTTSPSVDMSFNTAVGYQALMNNSSGHSNTALGYQALLANSTGFNNIAIGYRTLDANISGSSNMGMGSNTLGTNIDGIENLAFGNSSLLANISGDYNVALGRSACQSALGDNNICIGRLALARNTGSGSIALGAYAGSYETADNTFYVGNYDFGDSDTEKANSLMYGTMTSFNSTNQLTVNAKFGVSTTSPSARFAVRGSGNATGRMIAFSGSTNIERFTMLDSGFAGFGTTSPTSRLSVTQSANTSEGGIWLAGTDGDYRTMYMSDTSGTLSFAGGDTAGAANIATLNSAGAWINASDRSYKDNIVNLDTKYNLETLMKIEPRFYTMKGSGKPQIGFIAQELKLVLPEVVEGEEGSMGISYGNMVALLITAVKEINMKVGKIVSEIKVLVLDSITAKVAIFDRSETEVASVSKGLEMKDQSTGNIYCITIKNGDWNKVIGKCNDVVTTTVSTSTSPITTPVSNSNIVTPSNQNQAQNSNSEATTTEVVSPVATTTPNTDSGTTPTPASVPEISPSPSPEPSPSVSPEPSPILDQPTTPSPEITPSPTPTVVPESSPVEPPSSPPPPAPEVPIVDGN